jgi:hypothetical protein
MNGAMKRLVCLASLLLLPAMPLVAQTAPASADNNALSLTDAEKSELLAHNTESSVDAARAGLGSGTPSRQIHGEIGALVGSHGTRSVYGTAAIPLGNNAGAVVSFEDSHYNWHR